MPIKKFSDVEATEIKAGKDTTIQVLIAPDEAPNFAMRRIVMQAGGSMPVHTNTVEHEQLVLGGRARVGLGDQIYEVEKDDVLFIPAGQPHFYETIGDEPFEFLCSVPNKPDKIEIVE
ncbi:MAG: cupin domain-containing protein [Anaerolineae bacterium]|jgi:quercetin dioxygenase-like cupin family protein|nr:cupin domain-containing protein [Anaerolineae bacterium]MBT4840886.1 cupin domain-containing protein [Anaerolineae bacterium]MBT7188940.1 cupin domain-containing protein [Anaerolineae bacterium]MBT7989588.1 cupin domain-containing protein [Anaerolineae bacterium]